MEFGLDTLFCWQTVLLGFGVYVCMFVLRVLAEKVFKKVSDNYYWKEIALPLLPVFIGALIGFLAVKFPFPAGISSKSARILYGVFCGFLSSKIYRIASAAVDKFLAEKNAQV
jgi:hypothetical protein